MVQLHITITVVSASVGDVVYIKNGVYREEFTFKLVPTGVTVQGESLRGTEIRPGSGTGHQDCNSNIKFIYNFRCYRRAHIITFIKLQATSGSW